MRFRMRMASINSFLINSSAVGVDDGDEVADEEASDGEETTLIVSTPTFVVVVVVVVVFDGTL